MPKVLFSRPPASRSLEPPILSPLWVPSVALGFALSVLGVVAFYFLAGYSEGIVSSNQAAVNQAVVNQSVARGSIVSGGGTKFYVAVNGKDSWSGKSATPNARRSDGPFATLERARDAVRKAKTQGLPAPFTVSLRGGAYVLSRPFTLEMQDSGSDKAPTTYRAYGNEKVTLSGGRRITGWERGQGSLYTAYLPEVQAGRWNFNALFVNGARATRARTPNRGQFYNIVPPVEAGLQPNSDATYHSFGFRAGDINPAWSNLNEIEVVSDRRANQSRARIAGVMGNRVMLQSYSAKPYEWEDYNKGRDRYFLDNVREGLDSPGEWYLDRKSGVLAYWPLPGQDMESASVVAPVLSQLVEIRGVTNRLDLDKRPFTISAWVKTADRGTRNLVSDWFPDAQYQMTARNPSAVNGYTFGISEGKMLVGIGDYRSPVELGTYGANISDDRWHHLCAVYNRENKRIICYIDGAEVGTLILTRSFDGLETDLPVLLGDFYKQPFDASLDELLIYSRALSATEIAALHDGAAPPRDKLELAMSFEGNLSDSANNNRAATVTGDLSYVPGIKGQALHHAYDARTAQDSGQQNFASFPFAPQSYVHDIVMQGLTFSYTGSVLLPSGYAGHQSNIFLIDKPAISLVAAEHIRFRNNTVAHVGGHGLMQVQSSHITVEGNRIYDTAANGVMVAGGSGNTITDNIVHDVGVTYAEGTGIIVGIEGAVSGGNRIAHNHVYKTPYAGISVGMTWRTDDRGQNDNITEYNNVHAAMQELNDGGGIYSNGFQRDSVIRNNCVHDIYDVEKTDLFRDAGIYLDNGSKGITVTNNVVYRTGGNIFLNDTHGTTITNNIFADGMAEQGFLFDEGVELTHNIFYYGASSRDVPLFWNGSGNAVSAARGGLADYNLYFNRTNPNAGDWQLRSWRDAAGNDKHGRIADPLFKDYAHDDFALTANSPAFALGFKNIDVGSVGPRKLLQ